MPLYEFQCAACAKTFEVLVKHNETAECPYCASKTVERRLSAFAVGASTSAEPHCPSGNPCHGCPNGRCPMSLT